MEAQVLVHVLFSGADRFEQAIPANAIGRDWRGDPGDTSKAPTRRPNVAGRGKIERRYRGRRLPTMTLIGFRTRLRAVAIIRASRQTVGHGQTKIAANYNRVSGRASVPLPKVRTRGDRCPLPRVRGPSVCHQASRADR